MTRRLSSKTAHVSLCIEGQRGKTSQVAGLRPDRASLGRSGSAPEISGALYWTWCVRPINSRSTRCKYTSDARNRPCSGRSGRSDTRSFRRAIARCNTGCGSRSGGGDGDPNGSNSGDANGRFRSAPGHWRPRVARSPPVRQERRLRGRPKAELRSIRRPRIFDPMLVLRVLMLLTPFLIHLVAIAIGATAYCKLYAKHVVWSRA